MISVAFNNIPDKHNDMKTKQCISAEIIADSKNQGGQRITTFVLTFPRIVLAEYNTYRMLTRNSASSRAIPFKKMLKSVLQDPFVPIKYMRDHQGMQGNVYFTNPLIQFLITQLWLTARNLMVILAWTLSKVGLTKQIVNRLLEPFLWHKIITTATDWENFFALRAEGGAEIHIQALAYLMLDAYNISKPKLLQPGEWHMPFGDNIEREKLYPILAEHFGITIEEISEGYDFNEQRGMPLLNEIKLKIATARCARTSYNDFSGESDYKKDIQLHDRLAKSGHWSPFEHCARCMSMDEILNHSDKHYIGNNNFVLGYSGNYRGWQQYRKTFQGENRKDSRVR